MTFKESDLQFKFLPTHWRIKQYDTHRYFKILSGAGLKGVDFLGIYKGEKVVFFEVKNFHTNHPTKPPSYLIFEDTPAFIHGIADKMEDTLMAVKVVIQYLERKWWYRAFLQYKSIFPQVFIQNRDWYYWYQIHKLIQQKNRRILVLWLEIDHHYSPFSREKIKKLIDTGLGEELFEIVGTVEVANRYSPVFKEGLEVLATK